MRILIVSDLHHELWREHAPTIDPSVSRPDIVVLAGDINTGSKAVEWAATTFPGLPVLYVHGNHEAYGRNLEDTQAEIRKACEATENVHFLDCEEYILDDVRFLGATLWTDFRLFGDDTRAAAMREAEAVKTDYKRIRLSEKGYRQLRSADTARFHLLHRSWLTKKLDEPFVGTTVVITHGQRYPHCRSGGGRDTAHQGADDAHPRHCKGAGGSGFVDLPRHDAGAFRRRRSTGRAQPH